MSFYHFSLYFLFFTHLHQQNILSIYREIETNQIFGTKEIVEILHFSSSGARKILNKIIDIGIVVPVKGKGKGRYRFLNNEEIQ